MKVLLPGALRLQHYQFEGLIVATNKASYVVYRGPWEIECWGRERLLDRVAHELCIDPVEVRRRNLLPEDAYPCRMLTGATLEYMTINRTLEDAVVRADYERQRRDQLAARTTVASSASASARTSSPRPARPTTP